MSGQDKRLNKQIEKISEVIQKNNLNLVPLFRHFDEKGKHIDDDRLEKYYQVNNAICLTIGELKALTMPTAPRTAKKKEEYKDKIQDLENKKIILEGLRKQQMY